MDSSSSEIVHALSIPPLIEGIGNEVLLLLPLLAVILPSLCYLVYRHSALPALPADHRDPTPDQLREQFLVGLRARGNCEVVASMLSRTSQLNHALNSRCNPDCLLMTPLPPSSLLYMIHINYYILITPSPLHLFCI